MPIMADMPMGQLAKNSDAGAPTIASGKANMMVNGWISVLPRRTAS
jgi:hypothetical protein